MIGAVSRASAAALLNLILLAGCDNVHWGGADVVIVPPPPRIAPEEAPAAQPGTERLPEGPILYHVRPNSDGTAILTPVAEIDGTTLRPIRAASDWDAFNDRFIAEHLREGAEFTLFRRGARAGSLFIQSVQPPDGAACAPLPRASGIVELTAAASQAPEFLALARMHAPQVSHQPASTFEPDQRMRLLAPILAEQLIRSRRAMLPNDWQRAAAQIQPFPLPNGEVGFAATFLVGDTLGPGLDDSGQATFFIAVPNQSAGFDTVYVHFVDYESSRKAAPRVVDFLDWNRDGRTDLLLQVYGTQETWFEAVGHDGQRWTHTFDGSCTDAAPGAVTGETANPADDVAISPDPQSAAPQAGSGTAPAGSGATNPAQSSQAAPAQPSQSGAGAGANAGGQAPVEPTEPAGPAGDQPD